MRLWIFSSPSIISFENVLIQNKCVQSCAKTTKSEKYYNQLYFEAQKIWIIINYEYIFFLRLNIVLENNYLVSPQTNFKISCGEVVVYVGG